MSRNIYFAITIDTECDKGPGWIIKRPLSFKSVIEGIPERLEPIFKQYGAKATYLLSPEVIQDDNCIAVLKEVQQRGAELGTHLHGEFIEPESDTNTDATWQMQNTYGKDIEYQKLKNLTDLFVGKFGFCPRSFRAGRFGIGNDTLPILSELGYTVDSSVTPFCTSKDKGGSFDFFGVPTQPYYPDRGDFKIKGTLPILEIPITVGKTWYEYIPLPLLRSVPRYPFIWKIPHFLFKKQFNPIMFRPTLKNGTFENMRELVLSQLTHNDGIDVFLVMMLHNVDVVPGCSPYSQTEAESTVFLSRLEQILGFAEQIGATSITLCEARDFFESST